MLFVPLWLIPVVATAAEDAVGWDAVPAILARIVPPQFPDRDFKVADYGAVGDGAGRLQAGLRQGDRRLPRGRRRTRRRAGRRVARPRARSISNRTSICTLDEGATVRFSTEPADYLPVVLTRFEGNEVMNYLAAASTPIDAENIAITGEGTFDGQAGAKNWWPWKGSPAAAESDQGLSALRQMGEDGVPAAERVFGDGHYLRPNFVQPYRCKNVLIEGVTFTNSPMWILNPVLCENVTIRGVTVDSHGPNNDGCDPESCRDVLIENCTFDTGDDCIAIKSGRNADGRRIGVPSENIIIRDCTMKDGHGGVVLGSEMSGGIRNVFVEDCRMDSPNLDRAIRLKSQLAPRRLPRKPVRPQRPGRPGEGSGRPHQPPLRGRRGEHYPTVRNIHIENLTSNKSGRPFYLVGLGKGQDRERRDRKLHVQERGQAERLRARRPDHAPQLPPRPQRRLRQRLIAFHLSLRERSRRGTDGSVGRERVRERSLSRYHSSATQNSTNRCAAADSRLAFPRQRSRINRPHLRLERPNPHPPPARHGPDGCSGTIETPSPASTIRTMRSVLVASISIRGARARARETHPARATGRSNRARTKSAARAPDRPAAAGRVVSSRVPPRRDETPLHREPVAVLQLRRHLVRRRHAQRHLRIAADRFVNLLLRPRAQPDADRRLGRVKPPHHVDQRVRNEILAGHDMNFPRLGRLAKQLGQFAGPLQKRNRVRQQPMPFLRQRRTYRRTPRRLRYSSTPNRASERNQPIPQPLLGQVQHLGRRPQIALPRQLHQRRHLIGRKRRCFGHNNHRSPQLDGVYPEPENN